LQSWKIIKKVTLIDGDDLHLEIIDYKMLLNNTK